MALLGRTLGRTGLGIGRLVWDRPLSTTSLIEFMRSIRFFLTSGMTLHAAMKALGAKGTRGVRGAARDLARELAAGWSFESALLKQEHRFPPLFISLATVGEETGKLPEVMKDLERYYEMQQKQQRKLWGEAIKPLAQFVIAVIVIAGLICVLGSLPQPPAKIVREKVTTDSPDGRPTERFRSDASPYDVTGLGLVGESGAILFLVCVFGAILGAVLLFRLTRILLGKRPLIERIVLALPFVGSCARALALARFSFAMQLMLDSSMSILKTIRLAFAATDNSAFAAAGPKSEAILKRGTAIVTALEATRLCPAAYLSAASVGEVSGHMPEVMHQQAEYYDELAQRRIAGLYTILGYLVWVGVAVFIAFLVLRLVTVFYIGAIDESQNLLDKRASGVSP